MTAYSYRYVRWAKSRIPSSLTLLTLLPHHSIPTQQLLQHLMCLSRLMVSFLPFSLELLWQPCPHLQIVVSDIIHDATHSPLVKCPFQLPHPINTQLCRLCPKNGSWGQQGSQHSKP